MRRVSAVRHVFAISTHGGLPAHGPLTWRLVPTLLLVLTLTACGVTNLRGHDVQLSEVPYVFRGQRLALQIGTPSVPAAAGLPLALFIEGDGGQCQDYRPGLWRRFLLRFTGNFKLVRPRGFVNVTCDTEAWRSLDFRARIDELAVEIAVLKARFPGSKLFLVGHSAGAHVAILYASDHAGDIAGIVNLGGGLQELRLVLHDIAAGRARSGRATDTDTALAEARELVSGVEARGPDDAAPFWNRTYRFWYQMFFSRVQAQWSHPPVPVLIIHGGRDLDSVPFEQVQIQARSIEGNGIQFHAFADKGHDLLDAEVFRAVDEWIQGISKNGGQSLVGAGASVSARSATQPMADRIMQKSHFC